jgi:hypothetical protein
MFGIGRFRCADWHHELYFLAMFSAMRSIVYDLRKHGSKVKVCAMMFKDGRVDVSQLFPLRSEEWRKVCFTKFTYPSLC